MYYGLSRRDKPSLSQKSIDVIGGSRILQLFEEFTYSPRGMPHAKSNREGVVNDSLLQYIAHHSWNCSRYLVAASTASSTFSGCGPLLTQVDPFPTAFPPTTLEILAAHSLAERPALLAS